MLGGAILASPPVSPHPRHQPDVHTRTKKGCWHKDITCVISVNTNQGVKTNKERRSTGDAAVGG